MCSVNIVNSLLKQTKTKVKILAYTWHVTEVCVVVCDDMTADQEIVVTTAAIGRR